MELRCSNDAVKPILSTGQFKKKVTLSHVYNEKQPLSLQSRDIQQFLGKLLKFVYN
jgi:hypothetical protein